MSSGPPVAFCWSDKQAEGESMSFDLEVRVYNSRKLRQELKTGTETGTTAECCLLAVKIIFSYLSHSPAPPS